MTTFRLFWLLFLLFDRLLAPVALGFFTLWVGDERGARARARFLDDMVCLR